MSSCWKEKGEIVREERPKGKKTKTTQQERRCRFAKDSYENKETGTRG